VFEIERKDDGRIALSGRFDAAQVDKARALLDTFEESFVVDMTELDYISSAGLGILLATYKRLADSGHTLTLSHMKQHIRRIFNVSGLDKVFPME
jgi:anti-sigma B factor antagonist